MNEKEVIKNDQKLCSKWTKLKLTNDQYVIERKIQLDKNKNYTKADKTAIIGTSY